MSGDGTTRTIVTSGPVPVAIAIYGPTTAVMVIAIVAGSADLDAGPMLLVAAGSIIVALLVTAGALLYRRSTRVTISHDGLRGANQHGNLLPWDELWGFWWEVIRSGVSTGDLDPRPWVRLVVSRKDGEAYAVGRWVRVGRLGGTARVGHAIRAAAQVGLVPGHVTLPPEELPPPSRTIQGFEGLLPNARRPVVPSD